MENHRNTINNDRYKLLINFKNITTFLKIIAITFGIIVSWQIYREQGLRLDDKFFVLLGERDHDFMNFFFQTIYQAGGIYITGSLVAIILGIIIWQRYWNEAKAFAFATLGILILVDRILKPFFDRNRPPKPRLVEDLSRHSFPSGHAAGSLVLYFYLSFIVAMKYPQLKVYVYALATAIVGLIGFASIYTKAHWLTDVLAGYVFGYLWLIVSLSLLKFLQHKSSKQHSVKLDR